MSNSQPDQKFCYDYPRPAVTADSVLFSWIEEQWHLLLIERGNEPYKGCWAFPGGFLDEDETIESCANRELLEETGISGVALKQFSTFSAPHRDPRGRTISIVFTGFADASQLHPEAGDDAAQLGWFSIDSLPELAFDHQEIIKRILSEIDFPKIG